MTPIDPNSKQPPEQPHPLVNKSDHFFLCETEKCKIVLVHKDIVLKTSVEIGERMRKKTIKKRF